jgi:hypothetical protein
VIVCIPPFAADGVKVTEHLLVLLTSETRVHLLGQVKTYGSDAPKLPVPLLPKVIVPAGFDFVPSAVSVTVAVHVVDWLTTTEAGEHDTEVQVERRFTVWVSAALVLPLKLLVSLTYEAARWCVPVVVKTRSQ